MNRLTWLLLSLGLIVLTACAAPAEAPTVPQPAAPTLTTLPPTRAATVTLAADTPSVPATLTPGANPSATPAATDMPVIGGEMPICTGIGQNWVSPVDGMTLLCIPAGDFLMGEDPAANPQAQTAAQPQHRVYLDAFWIDQTEVTNAQYALCVQAGVCEAWEAGPYFDPNYFNNGSQPVNRVTREDAQTYCAWAGRRLPSEAQWEKAARGADGRTYPWGDEKIDCTRANARLGSVGPSCGGDVPAAVGSYPAGASPYGALDMIGNLREIVLDQYDETYYSRSPYRDPLNAELDPAYVQSWSVRGGSWYSMPYARTAAGRDNMRGMDEMTGFRCAYPDPRAVAGPTATPPALARTLLLTSPAMSGEDVFALQARLVELGYAPGVIDGVFGAKTDSAVRAFQQRNQLVVDGQVGPKTWAALFSPDAVAFAYPEPTYTVAKTIEGEGAYLEAVGGKVWIFSGSEIVVADAGSGNQRTLPIIAIQPLFKANGKVWIPTIDDEGWGVLTGCAASGASCNPPIDFSQKPGFEPGESVIYGVDSGSFVWVLRDSGLYAMSYDFAQVLNHPTNLGMIIALGFDDSRLWIAGPETVRVLNGASGALLYTLDLANISALAYDGAVMWALNGKTSLILALDPTDGTVLAAFKPCNRVDDIASDGGLLWAACFEEDQVLGLQIEPLQ